MARTVRVDGTARDGRSWEADVVRYWRHESKPARKATNRKNRREAVAFCRSADAEATMDPRRKGTEGWLTH